MYSNFATMLMYFVVLLCCCYVPAVRSIKRCRDPSVRPSVRLSHLGLLGAHRLGQATRAVRTADPYAHGRRSAAICGRHIVSPRDNLLVSVSTDGSLGSVCCTAGLAEVGFLGLIFV